MNEDVKFCCAKYIPIGHKAVSQGETTFVRLKKDKALFLKNDIAFTVGRISSCREGYRDLGPVSKDELFEIMFGEENDN